MNRDSKFWWFPLARRVLGWGVAGALLWALPVFVAVGGMALYFFLFPSPSYPPIEGVNERPYFDISLWFCFVNSGFFATMGAITNAFAVYYVFAKDIKTSLQSPFFRSVNRHAFCLTSLTSLLGCLILGVLLYPAFAFALWIPFGLWLILSVVLFIFALRRAITRALEAATASDYNA